MRLGRDGTGDNVSFHERRVQCTLVFFFICLALLRTCAWVVGCRLLLSKDVAVATFSHKLEVLTYSEGFQSTSPRHLYAPLIVGNAVK